MTDRQDPKTFSALLTAYPPEIAALASAARDYVLGFMPGAYEIVWPQMKMAGYGTGPKKLSEHFTWIAPYGKHVVFGFYYGGELPDPHKLLEGTGALMRHVKLRSVDDLKKPGLRELLVAATKHRVPPLRDDAEADLAAARKAALAGPANKAKAAAKAAKAAPPAKKTAPKKTAPKKTTAKKTTSATRAATKGAKTKR